MYFVYHACIDMEDLCRFRIAENVGLLLNTWNLSKNVYSIQYYVHHLGVYSPLPSGLGLFLEQIGADSSRAIWRTWEDMGLIVW